MDGRGEYLRDLLGDEGRLAARLILIVEVDLLDAGGVLERFRLCRVFGMPRCR